MTVEEMLRHLLKMAYIEGLSDDRDHPLLPPYWPDNLTPQQMDKTAALLRGYLTAFAERAVLEALKTVATEFHKDGRLCDTLSANEWLLEMIEVTK